MIFTSAILFCIHKFLIYFVPIDDEHLNSSIIENDQPVIKTNSTSYEVGVENDEPAEIFVIAPGEKNDASFSITDGDDDNCENDETCDPQLSDTTKVEKESSNKSTQSSNTNKTSNSSNKKKDEKITLMVNKLRKEKLDTVLEDSEYQYLIETEQVEKAKDILIQHHGEKSFYVDDIFIYYMEKEATIRESKIKNQSESEIDYKERMFINERLLEMFFMHQQSLHEFRREKEEKKYLNAIKGFIPSYTESSWIDDNIQYQKNDPKFGIPPQFIEFDGPSWSNESNTLTFSDLDEMMATLEIEFNEKEFNVTELYNEELKDYNIEELKDLYLNAFSQLGKYELIEYNRMVDHMKYHEESFYDELDDMKKKNIKINDKTFHSRR